MAEGQRGRVGYADEGAGPGLRVLIAGNDPLARGGLASLLGTYADLKMVGQAPLTEELLRQALQARPQAMVWDCGMDPSAPLALLHEMEEPEPPILALLADEAQAAQLLEAGARGLLLRDADGDKIASALRALALGLVVVEQGLTLPTLRARSSTEAPELAPLTPRELEVLQLLAQGKSNKEIAQRLSISEHTVKFHVNAILSKLGVQSRTEAVIAAARRGLVIL